MRGLSVTLNSTLEVDGVSALSAVSGTGCTLEGNLGVGPHAEDFVVLHATGDMFVAGQLSMQKQVELQSNVTLGQGKR